MIKKENPWFLCLDRWALVLFTVGAFTLSGANQLRVLGIMLVLAVVVKFALSDERWKWNDHPRELMCYTIWGLWVGGTGVFISVSREWFFDNYRILLQMIVMIWAVYGMLRLRMSERLVYWAILAAAMIQIISVFMGYSLDKGVGIVEGEEVFGEGRVSGITGNANSLGFIMVTAIHCVMQLWKMKKSPLNVFVKLGLLVFLGLALYTTFATGSRKTTAAIVILAIGWLVWLLPPKKGVATVIMRVLIAVGLLAVSGSVYMYVMGETEAGKRFRELFDRGGGSIVYGVEDDIRFDMYQAGFRMFAQHPIAGVGLGQFQLHYWKGAYSHSDYIEPLACTGLVGFLFYHGFNFWFILRLFRLRKRLRNADEVYKVNAMLLSMFVIFLLGFGAPYWSVQRHFVFLTTLVAYVFMLEKKLSGTESVTDQEARRLGLVRRGTLRKQPY